MVNIPIYFDCGSYNNNIIIIMFYSVQNQCTDGPLASCASGQSTTYINYIKLASYILTGYNIRYT